MDRKKKILTVIGTIIFACLLVGFIWYIFFRSEDSGKQRHDFSIDTPKVDEKKIRRSTKMENYEQENLSEKKSKNPFSKFFDFTNGNEVGEEQDTSSTITNHTDFENRLNRHSKLDSNKIDNGKLSPYSGAYEESLQNSGIEELMEMQKYLLEQNSNVDPYVDPNGIESLLREYNHAISAGSATESFANLGGLEASDAEEQDENETENRKVIKNNAQNFGAGTYFQGAGAAGNESKTLNLIPAETVDEELLFNGSTIAIRTKKDIKVNNPAVLIPKGSIVYGKVSITADRMMVDVNSYKGGLKLYMLNFKIYDYDGREGIHLGNRTWPKIPSKVAKDVYNYAYQKGTQATAFGSNNDIDLNEAKNIAILSAAKNVGDEVFEKRKVLMPKKYYLWFNIQED